MEGREELQEGNRDLTKCFGEASLRYAPSLLTAMVEATSGEYVKSMPNSNIIHGEHRPVFYTDPRPLSVRTGAASLPKFLIV